MNAKAIVPVQPTAGEFTVEQVRDQVNKIQLLMKEALIQDTHYGKIPGTDKDTLFKAGAEKICFMFRLAPTYDIRESWDGNHLTVNVKCDLIHIPTGQHLGSGHGMGSTKESKYAYRKTERLCPKCGKDKIIKGKAEYGGGWLCFAKKGGCGAKFEDKDPAIVGQITDRIPNPDLADAYNTVVKMACKRAHVAATLTATAASDVFTQDMEEGYEEAHAAAPPPERLAPASMQGASSAMEGAKPTEGQGSPPQAVLTGLYNGMKAAAEKDGLPGLVKWWREHQKEIKALPEPSANQIAAWKEEMKQVLTIAEKSAEDDVPY
jgi:hypothetical protein